MSTGVSTRPTRIAPRTVALCFILIALGIVFRFGNLNQVYWHDETFTSLRMSGYTAPNVKTDLFNGETLVTVDNLMQYQWPNEGRTIADTVNSLVVDDPQHPPVYYVLVRQWVAAFGHSIWIARSLSALISLLSFPAMYWLCQELFTSTDVKQRINGTSKATYQPIGNGSLGSITLSRPLLPRSPRICPLDGLYSDFERPLFKQSAPP